VSIQVSGGDRLVVAAEELLGARDDLVLFAERARAAGAETRAVSAAARALAPGAVWRLEPAQDRLVWLAVEARALAAELRLAAEAYAVAERAALARQHALELALLRALQLLPGGALDEGAVTVAQSGAAFRASAPAGFADLAARIPDAGPDAPQVRVERYALDDGSVHWVVYSAGTSSWSPFPGADPWDLTSNVVGVAAGGAEAGSSAATLSALREAGWVPGESVLPVGHSQGGIVATALATSGAAASPLLVTFGSPTREVRAPAGTLDVAVEHTEDPVPGLGGSLGVPGDRRVVVREAGPPVPGTGPLPAHAMAGYLQTAQAMDASANERLLTARGVLEGFTGGKDAQVTLWLGERVPPVPGGADGRGAIGRGAPASGSGAW